MANLSISRVCNLKCPYCFTDDYQAAAQNGRRFMPLDDFDACLDFLDRSGIGELRLLGGEPTLHPDFVEFITRGRARGKTITLFTNGLMPAAALECLAALPVDACFVLMNINAPEKNHPAHLDRQRAALTYLGKRAMPGFNIHRPDFDPRFLFEIIAASGCQAVIRLGLAQPCLSGSNQYIHPKQYAFIGRKIATFAEQAAQEGITFDFDCGFVPCMFESAQLERLQTLGTKTGWHCNPILDIDVYGQVIQCYPLAQLGNLPLSPTSDAATYRHIFEDRTRAFRTAGIFPECAECTFKAAGDCAGGCLSATIRRFHHTPFSITIEREVERP